MSEPFWNYRVCLHEDLIPTSMRPPTVAKWLGIHEVHYSGDGKVTAFAVEPAVVMGDDPEELRRVLLKMVECLDKEILRFGETDGHQAGSGDSKRPEDEAG